MNKNHETELILLNDFKAQWEITKNLCHDALERVGRSGWVILGDEVSKFEASLSTFWGIPHTVGCGSGLDAIEIGLRCLGIKFGQKVLTTPLSAFATTLAILRCGGIPVFCDVDSNGLMDLDMAESILKSSSQPIEFLIPVHLYGHSLDLQKLSNLKNEFSLKIVEDCAQSIGASSGGLPCGSVGQMTATSFYPTKNLGCMGDGGAVLTSDPNHEATARQLRDYGQKKKYEHELLGMNSRLDEIQAAFLNDAYLPQLPTNVSRRRQIAKLYLEGIQNPKIKFTSEPEDSESVWHLFPLFTENRDQLSLHLKHHNISSGVHYPSLISEQGALSIAIPNTRFDTKDTPVAKKITQTELSIPIHPQLSDNDIKRVISACNSWEPL